MAAYLISCRSRPAIILSAENRSVACAQCSPRSTTNERDTPRATPPHTTPPSRSRPSRRPRPCRPLLALQDTALSSLPEASGVEYVLFPPRPRRPRSREEPLLTSEHAQDPVPLVTSSRATRALVKLLRDQAARTEPSDPPPTSTTVTLLYSLLVDCLTEQGEQDDDHEEEEEERWLVEQLGLEYGLDLRTCLDEEEQEQGDGPSDDELEDAIGAGEASRVCHGTAELVRRRKVLRESAVARITANDLPWIMLISSLACLVRWQMEEADRTRGMSGQDPESDDAEIEELIERIERSGAQ